MLSGYYQDVILGEDGQLEHATGWIRNTVVYSCWPLVAGLLKADLTLRGIQYLAVGEGNSTWDLTAPQISPATTQLVSEVTRVAIDPSQATYLDIHDEPIGLPTSRLEIQAGLAVTKARTLREFGLYGGVATPASNSGFLINYVAHRRIDLAPGKTLRRRMRLSFRPGMGVGRGTSFDFRSHWLSRESVLIVDGVGDAVAKALQRSGVTTVAQLAAVDPAHPPEGLSATKTAELRAKARLAVETAAQLETVTALEDMPAGDLLKSTVESFAHAVPADVIDRLQDQLGVLQLALDARTIQRMTPRQLRGGV